jgi:hypothetical protein
MDRQREIWDGCGIEIRMSVQTVGQTNRWSDGRISRQRAGDADVQRDGRTDRQTA